MIQAEGVESLSEAELREDCRERGMLGALSVEEMRQQVLLFVPLCLYLLLPLPTKCLRLSNLYLLVFAMISCL